MDKQKGSSSSKNKIQIISFWKYTTQLISVFKRNRLRQNIDNTLLKTG